MNRILKEAEGQEMLVSDVLYMQNHGHSRINFFGQQGKEQKKEQLRWEKDELWNKQA